MAVELSQELNCPTLSDTVRRHFDHRDVCWQTLLNNHQKRSRLGTISGRVVNENGQPLVGATVSISQAGTVSSVRSTISNLEGNFQVKWAGERALLRSRQIRLPT